MMFRFGLAASISLLLALTPAPAAAWDGDDLVATALKPGKYVWAPERSAEGPVDIVISLGEQRAYVYRGGTLIGVSTISSGTKGRVWSHWTLLAPERVHGKTLDGRASRRASRIPCGTS